MSTPIRAVPHGRAEPPPPGYLGSREAARLLGVKPQTLYAYVSRGLLRRVAAGVGGRSFYLREDVDRLRTRQKARAGLGAVAASALRWGEPVLESALTGIAADGPRYRGHAAGALLGRPYEAVAELLWTGALPAGRPDWRARGLGLDARLCARLLGPEARPLQALIVTAAGLAASQPAQVGLARELELSRARELVRRLAAAPALITRSAGGVSRALAERSVASVAAVAFGIAPKASARTALEHALILSADHELNVSSFAARVAASAGADLHACVAAALATLSGPRHGGMCDRIEALVEEVARPERASRVVAERLRRADGVPGFGHPLYPAGDPRTPPLLQVALEVGARSRKLQTLLAVIEAMRRQGREDPTLDSGLVAVSLALRLPPGAAVALFAIGRAAGWIAHALEQRDAGYLLRPRALYVGPRGDAWRSAEDAHE